MKCFFFFFFFFFLIMRLNELRMSFDQANEIFDRYCLYEQVHTRQVQKTNGEQNQLASGQN